MPSLDRGAVLLPACLLRGAHRFACGALAEIAALGVQLRRAGAILPNTPACGVDHREAVAGSGVAAVARQDISIVREIVPRFRRPCGPVTDPSGTLNGCGLRTLEERNSAGRPASGRCADRPPLPVVAPGRQRAEHHRAAAFRRPSCSALVRPAVKNANAANEWVPRPPTGRTQDGRTSRDEPRAGIIAPVVSLDEPGPTSPVGSCTSSVGASRGEALQPGFVSPMTRPAR